MIDVDATKYDRTKVAVVSKFKRLLPPPKASTQGTAREPGADAVASGKGGVEARPQGVALEDGAASPDVDVPDCPRQCRRPASITVFPRGKIISICATAGCLRLPTMSAHINGNWKRGVDAFMNIARLCAEASARLTTAQKRELIRALPFGDTAFSKFVQIGTDTRLHAPDIQRLLPPHYTTMYAVTLLTDEELKQAIAENVIHPDMQRAQLQKWHRELSRKVELAPSPKEAASDSAVASAPIAPTQDGVESDALPAVSDDNRDNPEPLAVAREDAPPEAIATGAAVAGPLTPPPSDEDIPAFLDRRPMSAEDQRVFDMFMAAWNIASPVVRERIKAEVFGADASSRADAGIKIGDVEAPGDMLARVTPEVVVRRKRRRRRKVSGFSRRSSVLI